MSPSDGNPHLFRFQVAAQAASLSCILIGGLALAAWTLDATRLQQVLPGLAVMQPNSALAFVLAGVALRLRSGKPAGGGWKASLAQGSAGLVMVMGLLVFSEHLFAWDLGIARWLSPSTPGATQVSGQMTLTTSLYFALAGLGLLLLDQRPRAAQVLALWALLVPLVVLIVYSYSAEAAQRLPYYTEVALNATATFIALGVGILCARPERGMMALVASRSAGGILVRRVLPAAIALQVAVGYLRLAGQYQGTFTTEFGMAVSATAIVFGFAFVVWGCARLLERMEAQRQRAEAERDRFFTLSLDMLCIANADGYFKRLNPAFAQTLGWSTDELLTRPFLDFVHPEDREATLREVERQVAAGEQVLQFENRYQHQDGSWRVLSWKSVPQPGGFMYACARDITERKQAEEQLRLANQALEASNRKLKETQTHLVQSEKMASLGQLVAGIAHEINNPIAFVASNLFTSQEGLRLALQVELDGAPAARLVKVRRQLEEAEAGVNRVAELVGKLRTFSRLDEGHFKLVDIHENLDSVLLFLRHKTKDRIQVEKHYGPHSTLYCTGELNQVLMNLIANAVDAIEGQGRITLATGHRDGMFFILVKDTGRGIPAAIRERIFDPFFTTKPVGQGTGLGLAIAHSIVRAHQGRIAVHSEEGRGTEMTVEIPLDLEARVGEPGTSN